MRVEGDNAPTLPFELVRTPKGLRVLSYGSAATVEDELSELLTLPSAVPELWGLGLHDATVQNERRASK